MKIADILTVIDSEESIVIRSSETLYGVYSGRAKNIGEDLLTAEVEGITAIGETIHIFAKGVF